ncbi:MAG TPA: cupin domain-containing protein [Chthoniobacterales bacterium]|nr:cupin domain-containing protein [Chthoniobacterales bacterium]
MRKVNVSEIAERERRSPSGKFRTYFKEISVALGREPESTDIRRRHPFDLSLYRVPANASRCPYHAHSSESELYIILSGRGEIRATSGTVAAGAGDFFFFAPGEAHEIRNPGPGDLTYYVVADNSLGECCYYPDSDKWSVSDGSKEMIVEGREVDYYAGEDERG